MKISFITPGFNLGGYERVVVNYANSFSKLGHEITILCGFKSGELLNQVDKDVRIISLNSRIRNFLRPLIKYIKENEIDILYTPFDTYTSIAIFARLFSRKKFVIYGSSHGYDNGHRLLNYIFGKIIVHADVLTGVTKDLCVFDSVKYNIPLSKYKVFNNPVINIEENINNEFHAWFEDRKYPIICMSGRLDKNKNYYLALKIIKEVLKVRKVRLIIMGEGEEHKNLEDEVKKLDISDFVDLMGYVNNPLGYINQCDIFLHTAILESFGNVIVEALFCNKPIISTNCKGPEYILNHGEYGVLIGKSEDNDVIQNGVQAILDILDGNIKFENLKSKALEYNADFLEKDFIKYFYRKERG